VDIRERYEITDEATGAIVTGDVSMVSDDSPGTG
jgi:hypothetical protein